MADSELRQRKGAANGTSDSTTSTKDLSTPTAGPGGIDILDILRMLGGLALLSVALSKFVTGDSYIWGVELPRYLTDVKTFQSKVVSSPSYVAMYLSTIARH